MPKEKRSEARAKGVSDFLMSRPMKQSRTLDRAYRRMQRRAGCGGSVCTGGAYDKEEEDRKDMRIEKDLLKLRAHHLLCIPQYQGN